MAVARVEWVARGSALGRYAYRRYDIEIAQMRM